MTQTGVMAAGNAPPDTALGIRRTVALVMLFLVGTINFLDRQLLSVLVEPIRAEMDFSDTQFGLLTGLAFALFYAAMGVPVAMIADRWNRVKLVGIACLIWSGFTAACGMVSNFWQLALMRFGVGTGEAGGTAGDKRTGRNQSGASAVLVAVDGPDRPAVGPKGRPVGRDHRIDLAQDLQTDTYLGEPQSATMQAPRQKQVSRLAAKEGNGLIGDNGGPAPFASATINAAGKIDCVDTRSVFASRVDGGDQLGIVPGNIAAEAGAIKGIDDHRRAIEKTGLCR